MALIAILLTVLRPRVTHSAGADVGAGVAQGPTAPSSWQPAFPPGRGSLGKITNGVIERVLRFGVKIATGETHPERNVGIRAGQGKTSGGLSPCPLPPGEGGQGLRCLHRVPRPAMYRAHASKHNKHSKSKSPAGRSAQHPPFGESWCFMRHDHGSAPRTTEVRLVPWNRRSDPCPRASGRLRTAAPSLVESRPRGTGLNHCRHRGAPRRGPSRTGSHHDPQGSPAPAGWTAPSGRRVAQTPPPYPRCSHRTPTD